LNKFYNDFLQVVSSARKMPYYKRISILQLISGVLSFTGLPLLIPVLESYSNKVEESSKFMIFINDAFSFFNLEFNPDVLLLFIFLLLIFSLLIEVIVQYMVHFSQYKFFANLNNKLMKRYKEVSWLWLVNHSSGEINHALYNEASGASHNSFQALQFLISLFQLSLYGLLTIMLSWNAMLIVFSIAISILILNINIAKYIKEASYKKNNIQKEFSQLTQTIQQNKKLLKSFSNFDLLSMDYEEHIKGMVLNANIIAKYKQYQKFITSSIFIVIIVSLIGFQKTLNISVENILVILIIFARIIPYVQNLIASYSAYTEGEPIAESFYKKIDSLDQNKERHGNQKYIKNTDIVFNNINFKYSADRDILNDCSLSIKALEITAIIGESGSGKSTVLDLILGLLRHNSGCITYGALSSKELDYEDFRKHISYVSQETTLISGTIYDNLIFGNNELTEQDVKGVCKKVLLYDLIDKLPNGLYTDIGENGVLLSGGQRQRLAIGRALLSNRNIIILDEATSALDMESEKMIQETVSALKGVITIILVSHRLEMIKNADTIYKISNYKAQKIN
jgi:ABC-type multidrug transport system fused ATPase/permease subunit